MGFLDEGIQRRFEGAIPQSVIHQLAVGFFDAALVMGHVSGEGEAFQVAVGLDQHRQGGDFVNFPRFDPHEAVFHHVNPAYAMGTDDGIQLFN